MAARGGAYEVITPLESRRVDTSAQVRAVIDDYMRRDGASLTRVTVIYFGPAVEQAQMGQPLSAWGFWADANADDARPEGAARVHERHESAG